MKYNGSSFGIITVLIVLVLFLLSQLFGFFSEIKHFFEDLEMP